MKKVAILMGSDSVIKEVYRRENTYHKAYIEAGYKGIHKGNHKHYELTLVHKLFYSVDYYRKNHYTVQPHRIHSLDKGIGTKCIGAGENNRSKTVIALSAT